MLSVFTRVKQAFAAQFQNQSKDFEKGFRTCYELFQIGYEKMPLASYEIQALEARRELEEVQNQLLNSRAALVRKEQDLKDFIKYVGDSTKFPMESKLVHYLISIVSSSMTAKEKLDAIKDVSQNWDLISKEVA